MTKKALTTKEIEEMLFKLGKKLREAMSKPLSDEEMRRALASVREARRRKEQSEQQNKEEGA